MVFSRPGGAFFEAIRWLNDVANSCSGRSRSSAAATSRAAKSWKFVFLTRVSEGTLGPMDYHCRAPFRPSVPWRFPVREVHFLRQFVDQTMWQTVAASAAEAAQQQSQELPRAGNLCFLTRVSEGTLGPMDYHCRAPFRPSVPWCFPVREVHFWRQYVG